jgi:hypothetical protein
MKKNSFVLITLVLMLCVLYSCKKEAGIANTEQTGQTYTPEAMALWSKLNNFNQKIKSGLKAEEFISPDSAMWYLEALFNVQQATDTTFDDVVTYKRNYSLNVNTNGTVNMSDLAAVYNQLVADLQSEMQNIDADYKFMIIADLQETTMKSGDFEMELTAGIGINPLIYYEPITTDDNWYYGNMLGRCVNTQWDSDAGQELLRRFNNPSMALPNPSPYKWINPYVTPILTHEQFPNRIFHENATSPPCIEYTELEYYLKQGHYILYNTSTDIPSGTRPPSLNYRLMYLWTNNPNPPDNEYLHYYQIFYGTPISIPPID